MQIHTPITPPELIKLFDFLDSETPATREWVTDYFIKQGLHFNLTATPYATLSMQVSQFSAATYQGDIKVFAKKMRNAWGVKKFRERKDIVTLSVILDKETADRLALMSKGSTKAEILAILIHDNYQVFLESKREQKAKLVDEKKQRQLTQENAKHKKKIQDTPKSSIEGFKQSIVVKEMREQIAGITAMLKAIGEKVDRFEQPKATKDIIADLITEQMQGVQANILARLPIADIEPAVENTQEVRTTPSTQASKSLPQHLLSGDSEIPNEQTITQDGISSTLSPAPDLSSSLQVKLSDSSQQGSIELPAKESSALEIRTESQLDTITQTAIHSDVSKVQPESQPVVLTLKRKEKGALSVGIRTRIPE